MLLLNEDHQRSVKGLNRGDNRSSFDDVRSSQETKGIAEFEKLWHLLTRLSEGLSTIARRTGHPLLGRLSIDSWNMRGWLRGV